MEWMNKGGQPGQAPQPHPAAGAASHGTPRRGRGFNATKLALGLLSLLVIGLLVWGLLNMTRGGVTGGSAGKFVDSKRMQAVFLNGGQVYFGKITDINDKNLRMADIYYLRVNQTVQPNQQQSTQNNNDISLVKLGCELHGPQDSMVINQEQVIFWENLKDDGQVAQAVQKYRDQNPNGQQCNTNSGASNNSNTNTNNSNTNNNSVRP